MRSWQRTPAYRTTGRKCRNLQRSLQGAQDCRAIHPGNRPSTTRHYKAWYNQSTRLGLRNEPARQLLQSCQKSLGINLQGTKPKSRQHRRLIRQNRGVRQRPSLQGAQRNKWWHRRRRDRFWNGRKHLWFKFKYLTARPLKTTRIQPNEPPRRLADQSVSGKSQERRWRERGQAYPANPRWPDNILLWYYWAAERQLQQLGGPTSKERIMQYLGERSPDFRWHEVAWRRLMAEDSQEACICLPAGQTERQLNDQRRSLDFPQWVYWPERLQSGRSKRWIYKVGRDAATTPFVQNLSCSNVNHWQTPQAGKSGNCQEAKQDQPPNQRQQGRER